MMDRYDYVVVVAAVLCLVDGLMTLPFWHLEGNPVVLMLGPAGMMILKLWMVREILTVWFTWDGIHEYEKWGRPVGRWTTSTCAVGLFLLYALVVTTNVIVLLL